MFKVQKFDFLVAFYIGCLMMAETMGAKIFPILSIGGFNLNGSVAIFLIPILFTINDIVIEVYGKERARSLVRSGLFMVAFLFLFTGLAVWLEPAARFAASNDAYTAVFAKTMRFSAASLIALAIAEFTDIFIFSKIRARLGEKALWMRNNVSNFIAQFFDTVLFMTLAFYALDQSFGENFAFLWTIILPYWLLKCFMSVIETPFVYLGVKWLRNSDDFRMTNQNNN